MGTPSLTVEHNWNQGGSRQRNSGWAAYSNDDVIKSMTSLLLMWFAKKVGGPRPPRPTLRLPPWLKPWNLAWSYCLSCVKSALACTPPFFARSLEGGSNWDAAFEDVVLRIDRALPELGLLTDRQSGIIAQTGPNGLPLPSIPGLPGGWPIWMARGMDQP